MSTNEHFFSSLKDVKELETFTRDLIIHLAKRNIRPAPGEELSKYIKELGLKVPSGLHGEEIKWNSRQEAIHEDENSSTLVLMGPGTPDAIGLTIGCITIRSVKICLECGWFYCRIVIKGTFLQ